ncbi:MAG TPA: amino acid adenylation domain-containing protein, partial [Mycobacteriales bacterium]|nr:amino acid adenylation domain-containing protein [Mycobacteriales bacterium]
MDVVPLSPQQRHIWYWRQAKSTYDAGCAIQIDGDLSLRKLRAGLAGAVLRHGVLRTRIVVPTSAEEPRQEVAAGDAYSFLMVDVTSHAAESDRWWDRYGSREPDGSPTLRAVLLRQGPRRHLLVLTLPALCADARSLRNLTREIAENYGRADDQRENRPVTQYAQFAAWQNALLDEDVGEPVWTSHRPSGPVTALTLPFQAEPGSPGVHGYHDGSVRLPRGVLDQLDAVATRLGATLEEFLLCCWQTLLWQHTRDFGIVVGHITDGRVYEELRPVLGPCAKALPVRAGLAEADPFAEVLDRIRQAAGEAREWQEFPNWGVDGPESTIHPAWGFEFTELDPAIRAGDAEFALRDHLAWTGPFVGTLHCHRQATQLRVVLEYERGRIGDGMAECLLDQFITLATNAAAGPLTPVGSLSAVSTAQARRLVVDFNRTAAMVPDDRCAHQLVEEHAARTPDRLAVTFNDESMSYRELNTRANRLARYLRVLGAGREAVVGICLERSADVVVAMVAIHKAGAAYVPIDPQYPGDRIRAIMEGTGMPVLITREHGSAALPAGGWRTVWIDRDLDAIAAQSGADLNLDVDPRQIAYVLHTSGSTGVPKGVEVSHRALVNFLRSMCRVPGIGPEDSLVAVTTLSFDIAGLELYLPLTVGARVTVASSQTAADPRALGRLLADSTATILQATPVTWRMLVAAGWTGSPGLTALTGGEALPPGLAAQLLSRVGRLWNMYGPTETTIWSTCAEIGAGNVPVSVGRPIANTCVHVLDQNLHPVAVGMIGEVYIGGAGVARGYAHRPGLTAECFVPDPFGCHPGGRMYRTGDLGRYGPDGRLYLLGRTDSQVKIRGFRIELGEVETMLTVHPAVRAAVATARREPSGDLRLDAHVLLEPGARPSVVDLRGFLRDRLPRAMVPARIGVLRSLPLTANGKVDRAALPEVTAG